ncbi:MAG: hypothetical protein DRP47_09965 [Candidatus Zixiibacteriota bacterium]|nr:MAG: hypothetical protein DRP47_09965 [candidate division Zixibacteria bacterium]
MEGQEDPLNIELLFLTKNITKNMLEVKTRDIFIQNGTEFHHEGLFSTTIFGEVGSKERNGRFGYIDLSIDILHPRIYKELITLNSIYSGILDGTKYAVFDTKLKDFVESDRMDGKTGLNFFIEHYDNIKFKETDSTQRDFKIKFLKKFNSREIIMDKYLLIPAGLRDYKLLESGKALENEINPLYRKMLTISSSAKVFKNDSGGKDNEFVGAVRKRLQKVAVDIYDYLENLLDGKSKFVQGKWTKRAIMYGTRNVITSTPTEITDQDDETLPTTNSAIVGLYQATKGILPITVFNTRTRFLQDAFDVNSSKALLINKKTLKREPVDISEKTRSRWVTDDGVEETINKLSQDEVANNIVEIDGNYLLLVHEYDDKIDVVKSIDSLSPNVDVKDIRPITYGELFYLSIFDKISDYPAYLTRYPIVQYGGIIPLIPYLKSTIKATRRMVRLPDSMDYKLAVEYPIPGEKYYRSLSLSEKFLDNLGADFDGVS